MKQYNAQLKYVGARPRRDKKLGKGGSAVIAGSATPTGGVSKSYIDSNFVTLATEQAIPGRKNFVGGVEVNGQELVYDAEKKVWQLTGDLIVTGAVTMFGSLSGFTPSTVTDAVLVDGETIVKTKNSQGQWQLTAIGGGSGSGGTGGGLTVAEVNALINTALVPYALKESIPTNNTQLENGAGYITDSALNGYATEQWVSNQGFAKQSALTAVDNRLTAVEVFFATEDSDTLVNKWAEIVTFLNATEGDTLDNILKTKANQSALDDAVASLTTEIGKKWTQNDAKIANWDSAYGWGNHANAGYAAKTYVDGEFAKYVKLATAQDISAQHNFVNGLKIGGLGITKSQDDVIYVDANLVVRGAVTMFGNGATVAPSIWASIPFDDTMEWNGSEWGVADGGSGSVNEAAVNNLIYEYLTKNSYAKISDISSALTGYATQTWVEGKKYLTGITSSMVTTALGYTPYNSANFTKANIKTTLGISDWALAAAKPSYTAAEVGALSTSGGTVSGNLSLKETNSIILRPSLYTHYSGIGYDTKGDECIAIWAKNAATRLRWHAGIDLVEGVTVNSMMGITPDFEISKASGIAEGYIGGYAIIHSGNIGQQSVNYATSAGVADSANEAYRFRTIASVVNQLIDLNTECLGGGLVRNYVGPSYWKNAPDGLAYGMVLTFASGFSSTLQGQLAWDVNHASTVDTTRNLWWRANDQTDFANSKWHQIAFTDSNVASATKLQTARTIWGQSFDGTQDITGTFRLLYKDSYDGAVAHSILNKEVSPYGLLTRIYLSGAVSLQAQREITTSEYFPLYFNPLGGNVAIGGTTADELLHVYGVAKATLLKSAQGYTLTSSAATYCGLIPNNIITGSGNATDFWLYNTTDIRYQAANHYFVGGNVAVGGTTADTKLSIFGGCTLDGYKSTSSVSKISDLDGKGLVIGIDGLRSNWGMGFWTEGNGKGFIQQQAFAAGNPTYDLCLQPFGGNVVVGRTSASAKLHVGGDILADGAITMFSQLSMKNVIDYEGLSLAQLEQIKPARFTWKDGRDNRTHVGGIADYIQPILPEVVYETVNKELTVDYGSAAFYIGTSLIKPVIDHEKRIADLERENKQLKQQLEQLRVS